MQLDPPLGGNADGLIEAARAIKASGRAHLVDVNDNPRARARMSGVMASVAIERYAGIETIPHLTPRDSTLAGLESILLGAHAEGVRNILADMVADSADVRGPLRAFTWDTGATVGTKPDDKAILLFYCPEFNKSVYTLSGPDRSAGTGALSLPGFGGKDVHTWMSFISADGKEFSDSLYAGKVTLAS